jgi:hypothetical protein
MIMVVNVDLAVTGRIMITNLARANLFGILGAAYAQRGFGFPSQLGR